MTRRPISAVIVGAGFGGLAAAVKLKEQGVDALTIVERGARVGGVWNANTYPGAACDIPSQLYSLSFAPNPDWSRRFAPGDEIQAYAERIVDRFGLRRHLRLDTEVERATWDDERGQWRIELAGGDVLEADVFLPACGQLSRPRAAGLPGLDRFTGAVFHSAQWRHDVPLEGRRVAVVGTGASVIQIVPAIAERVGHLTVFQRSAPWTLPKLDGPIRTPARRLYARFPALQRLARRAYYREFEYLVPAFVGRPARKARMISAQVRTLSNLQRRIQLRGRPDLLAKATPDYPIGCKRILLTDDWFPTLRRENASLVTEPIREFAEDGIVTADGTLHRADVVVLGTGFAATEFLVPMQVVGRDGVTLEQAWAGGAEAHLGISVPGFPNMFLLYGPHTNHGTGSILGVLESATRYVGEAVGLLRGGVIERFEVRREAHVAFQRELDERMGDTVWTAGCGNWYVTETGRVTNNWPGTHDEYAERTATVDLSDLVTEAPRPQPAEI
jgi:cation diffusion facilitator CzcD-associated flavoprotein CzcO